MSTTSTKRNIVFATIPRDYVVLNPEERETKWRQFIELLHLEDFPIHRLYLFINPTGRMHIRLFYAELKKAQRGIRIGKIALLNKQRIESRLLHGHQYSACGSLVAHCRAARLNAILTAGAGFFSAS